MDPVKALQKYISIRTDHPDPDYKAAVKWLEELAGALGFETHVVELDNDIVALLVYFRGKNSREPAILLNSHIDVVKVDEQCWNFDPWAGEIFNGNMYGRGTQDMKSLGIQHLFACSNLMDKGFKPKRDIIMSFVPEEEVMGIKGMNLLTSYLPAILFALDEGIPSPDDTVNIYDSERRTWWLKIECFGNAGHGSKYLEDEDSAVAKAKKIMDNLQFVAEKEREKVSSGGELLGSVLTVNPTYLSAGNSGFYNVIPTKVEIGVDFRIPPSYNLKELYETIEKWCCEDEKTKITFQNGTDKNCFENPTSRDSEFLEPIRKALANKKIQTRVRTFPASTDARYLRAQGIPTFGISVLRNCPVLLHDNNEFIPIKSFLEGITFYEELLKMDL